MLGSGCSAPLMCQLMQDEEYEGGELALKRHLIGLLEKHCTQCQKHDANVDCYPFVLSRINYQMNNWRP